jgi:signal transduction histidine kinase
LGLSLVSAVVGAHGGMIDIVDNQPGLRIVITIPVARPVG